MSATTALGKTWSKPHVMNLEKCKIDLLQEIKKNRKYIIIATDKNLGPAIMEIDYYIHRCLANYLDDKNTYKELSEMEAQLINHENFLLYVNTSSTTRKHPSRSKYLDSLQISA